MNILVTGGSSGLGKHIVKMLAKNTNDTIYFTFNNSQAVAKAIEKECKNTKSLQVDFKSNKSLEKLLHIIPEIHLNGLVNNAVAYYLELKRFHEIDPDIFTENFTSTIIPTIKITQQFVYNLKQYHQSGSIVTILSSILFNQIPIGMSEYAAEKAYLASLSKSWAIEYKKLAITSNTVAPGFMKTAFTKHLDKRSFMGEKDEILETELIQKKTAIAVGSYLHSPNITGENSLIESGI